MSTEEKTNNEGTPPSADGSRRNFLKAAVVVSAILAVGGVASVAKAVSNPTAGATTATSGGFPKVKIANISDLKLNVPVNFNYPLDNEPNILVKLGQKADGGVGPDGDIVAFSQICQHLGCIYGFEAPGDSPDCNASYQASGPVGYCCCHGSIYDLLHGAKVIGGPAPRPEPQVTLEIDSSGDIYATGMSPPTIFGHDTGSSDVSADLQGGTPVS
ncbi:MAG: arsenate reductase (azurin) small subunit [Nitrososphaerota archaeon]|nr:arsenate reductase (azurin) small subunit [Nitrososphaerota archaeon]